MKLSTGFFSYLKTRYAAGAMLVMLGSAIGVLVLAQDLSDKDTCMMCHEAFEWAAPENSDRPRVHNDDGTFVNETHAMFTCTNCHQDIVEIPHRADVKRGVDCLNCHEAIPK